MKWMKWGEPTPAEGQEILVRTKAHNGKWQYQIGICSTGFFRNPFMGCQMCGSEAHFLPRTWNPFGGPITPEWMPLSKWINSERTASHAEAERDRMYERALKAEELLYNWYMKQDKKSEKDMITYVENGLENL